MFQPGTENVPHLELVGGIGGCRFSGRGTASKQQGLKAPCPGQTFIFPPLPPLDASKVQAKQLTGSARLIIVCAVSIQAIKIFLNVRCFSDKGFFFFFPTENWNPVKARVGNCSSVGPDPLFGCEKIFVRNERRNSVWRRGFSLLFPLWASLQWQNNVIFLYWFCYSLCINTEMCKWSDSQPHEWICWTNAEKDLLPLAIHKCYCSIYTANCCEILVVQNVFLCLK